MTDASSLASISQTPVTRTRRSAWRFVLWFVIFLSGTIVGAGGTLLFARHRLLASIHHPEAMPARLAHHLQRTLDLDEQQTQRIEAIFQDRQKSLQVLRREVQPKIEQELDRADQQISEVLDARQRATWQARFRRLRDRWLPALPPVEE